MDSSDNLSLTFTWSFTFIFNGRGKLQEKKGQDKEICSTNPWKLNDTRAFPLSFSWARVMGLISNKWILEEQISYLVYHERRFLLSFVFLPVLDLFVTKLNRN